MIEAYINKKLHSIPEKFSECSPKQALFLLDAIHNQKYRTFLDVKIAFLRKFTNIPFTKLYKLSRKLKKYSVYEEYENHVSKLGVLTQPLNFIEKKIELQKNIIPYLKYGFLKLGRLYPPADSLSNLKTWEMAFAVKYAKEYSGENPEELNHLIGLLYRTSFPFWKIRKKYGFKTDDRRRQFYDALIPLYVKRVAKIPQTEKIAILIWFNTAYQNFVNQNKDLFDKVSDNKPDDFSWMDMILSVEYSIPGDEEKIANSYALAFLGRLAIIKRNIENSKLKK